MRYKKQILKNTFGETLKKLQTIKDLTILQEGNAMIAVSGMYQGRIFTSTTKGMTGKNYGWVNWDLLEKENPETNMASLGGESRLWFVPEWGKYSLCFEAGEEHTDANLRRPKDLDSKQFNTIKKSKNSLTCIGTMQLKNDHDFVFDLGVERTLSILSKETIEKNLGLSLSDSTSYVGFSAETTVENIGKQSFKKETGLIGIWELGCMLTAPDNKVILPLSQPIDAITEYFSTNENRVYIKDKVTYYKADAQGLSKIGILPQYCKNVMGSYSPSQQLLNIVTFTFDKNGIFVNSLPHNTKPYAGDVINIFNGLVNEELNLPFYEFESISNSKELQPQEKMSHQQTTYHFEGTIEELNKIAYSVLGIRLQDIPLF